MAPAKPPGPGNDGITARNVGIVTGLTIGVIGLGIGTGFGVAGAVKRSDGLQKECGQTGEPAECQALRSEYDELVTAAVIGFVGAGVGAGVAGVLFLTRPAPTPAPAVGISPVIGPNGAGLGVWGQF